MTITEAIDSFFGVNGSLGVSLNAKIMNPCYRAGSVVFSLLNLPTCIRPRRTSLDT